MSRFYCVLVALRWRSLSELGCAEMQKFNTTNVALNSIRLATPSVKVAGGEDRSLEKFCAENRQFVLVCEEKSLIIPVCAEKRQNVPVLRCSSWAKRRSLSGLGCDEIQNFNTTNVVLNSILLATPCKSGVQGGWQFAQFRKVSRRKTAICPEFAKKKAKLSRVCEEKS